MSSSYGRRHGLVGYDDFRTGLTIRDAWAMLTDESSDRGEWRYKRRGTRLRLLCRLKKELYEEAVHGLTEEEVREIARGWHEEILATERRRYARRRSLGWRKSRRKVRRRPEVVGGRVGEGVRDPVRGEAGKATVARGRVPRSASTRGRSGPLRGHERGRARGDEALRHGEGVPTG
jgi:hypothetical protein